MKESDIVVVGGGPSGSKCAQTLARKGLDVILLEKCSRSRYKPCAGGISTKANELVPTPTNLIERTIVKGLIVSASKKSVVVGDPSEPGFTVYRNTYDRWLMEEAERFGVNIENGTRVKGISIDEDKVKIKAEVGRREEKYLCKVVVGAYGVTPNLYKFFGLNPPKCVVGVAYEFSLPKDTVDERVGDTIEVYFDDNYANPGYSWIFPKKNGMNVGSISLPSSRGKLERLKRFTREHPIASKKLEGAVPKKFDNRTIFAGLIPIEPLKKTYGERFLLVGDAAGLVDPLSYEGIGYALQSGIVAAETIVTASEVNDYSEETLSTYQSKWMQQIYINNIEYALKLNKLMFGHKLSNKIGDVVVELAQEDQEVKTALRYILTRKEPRRKVYEILMARKFKLMKKMGLLNSLQLIKRL